MRQRTHARYVFRWLLLVIAILVPIATFNVVVDPYGIWRLVEIRGLNAAKPVRRHHDYIFKAVDVMRLQPTTVFMGSSRVAYGLDPDHPALRGRGTAYNLSILGGPAKAIRRYFDHAVYSDPNLKTVIIGADFFAFGEKVDPPPIFREERLERHGIWPRDAVDTVLSLDALFDSVTTVISNHHDPAYQPYFANGMLTAIEMGKTVRRYGMVDRFEKSTDLYLNGASRFRAFALDETVFGHFAHIAAVSKERGINLIVFVPPVHAVLLESIRLRGLWPVFETWKRRLAAITPYWDFSGYNPVTTEPMARKMTGYWDISHYRRNVGDLILDRIFDHRTEKLPAGFGVRVTPETVEGRLQAVERERASWAVRNQPQLAWLKARLKN